MATSLQERLKLKQYQIDTWTTREQLCLASAVLRSGDQNWVAVRRNIKMLTTEHSRPIDWYSTKNCALQYAKLLECVDTPKRKRERTDSSNETPGEIVTKMLTKQHVDELKIQLAEEKATYNQQRKEIQDLEAGRLDHQLDAMWEQLVKERAEEEEEERRHQQWLQERQEKIIAIQQALKHQGPKVHIPIDKKKQKAPWPNTAGSSVRRNSGMSETSSEIDSALDSPDVHDSSIDATGQEGTSQEPETKPTPTSPLLSSLLSKSPILPGSSGSLTQARRPGYMPVSMALQNLVSSAISGTDSPIKSTSTTSHSSGSSTLSRLLDLPPSTPGGLLPKLSDLPPSSHEKESEKDVFQFKEDPETIPKCGDGLSKGCGPSTKITTLLDYKKEREDALMLDNSSRSLERQEAKFHQQQSERKFEALLNEMEKESTKTMSLTTDLIGGKDERPMKSQKDHRDSKKKEEKRSKDFIKERKTDVEESREEINKFDIKDMDESTSDSREDKFSYSRNILDEENEKKVKILKESKLYKELESQSKKAEKAANKDLDDYDQDSKDWMNDEDSNFPRSGKRKTSGTDYLGYSPLICESGPTSPASTHYGDDPETEKAYKAWKKPIMILWNEIAAHRFASIFLRPITDEQAPGYHSVVFRRMDLQTIKRNIESGVIRNTAEFQRDMMLMFLNATMYNTSDHNVHQMAHQMMQDTIYTIEEFLNTQMLARAVETPHKSLRRETRESSAKRGDDDTKRKRDHQEEKSVKKRR